MRNLSEEELTRLEEYASLYLTVDEIAILLDVNTDDLRRDLKNKYSKNSKAYHRGKLQTTIALRRQTKLFAEKGSPQAEQMMLDFSAKQKLSE